MIHKDVEDVELQLLDLIKEARSYVGYMSQDGLRGCEYVGLDWLERAIKAGKLRE